MDMVGVDIVGWSERGRSLLQPCQRQAVAGVDPGNAHNRCAQLPAPRGVPQLRFRRYPPFRARVVRPDRARFIDPRPATIAVNPGRARINQANLRPARGGARNPVGYNRRSFYGFGVPANADPDARSDGGWHAAFEGRAKPSAPRSLTGHGAG